MRVRGAHWVSGGGPRLRGLPLVDQLCKLLFVPQVKLMYLVEWLGRRYRVGGRYSVGVTVSGQG